MGINREVFVIRSVTTILLLVLMAAPWCQASGFVRVIVRLKQTWTKAKTSSTYSSALSSASPKAPACRAAYCDDLRARRVESKVNAQPVIDYLKGKQGTAFNTKVKDFELLWMVDGISATCKDELINELAALPNVEEVLADPFLEFDALHESDEQGEPWHLKSIFPRGRDGALSLDGQGVRVGVIDSGLALDSPVKDKVCAYRDFTSRPTKDMADTIGHGSAVASLIVDDQVGVAPKSELIVARVIERLQFSSEGRDRELVGAFASRIVAAMQWMIDPDGDEKTDDGPAVVNCSWGFPENPYLARDHFQKAIAEWQSAGIIPVFAAGNRRGEHGLVNFPADYDEVIAVGAHAPNDELAPFSCQGAPEKAPIKPDFVAPGVGVFVHLSQGLSKRQGTSFAAPLVAGTIALLAQVHPQMTYHQARNALRYGSRDLGPEGKDRQFGFGAINAEESAGWMIDELAWSGPSRANRFILPRAALRNYLLLAERAGDFAIDEALRRFGQNFTDYFVNGVRKGDHTPIVLLKRAKEELSSLEREKCKGLLQSLSRAIRVVDGLDETEREALVDDIIK